MTRKRIIISKQKEIHRLKLLGHNKSEVARLANANRKTVAKYWDEPLLEEQDSHDRVNEIDWDYIH